VLAGGCVELGDIGLAYLPVVDALRGLADDPEEAGLLAGAAVTAPGLGRLLPGIGPAAPPGGFPGDGLEQWQVFDAVRAALVGRSERSPVLLVLEDLHWADRATLDLVAFLARTLHSGRVTLAVARDESACQAGRAQPPGGGRRGRRLGLDQPPPGP
jgi:hypothetical protein